MARAYPTSGRPRTFERNEEIANKNIVPLLGSTILAKLKPIQTSNGYANAIVSDRRDGKGGLSARSVGQVHRALKQALGQAVKGEMLCVILQTRLIRPKSSGSQ